MTKRLVVGSYPPVPSPASVATVAAVRRGWDEGREVEVVSPRPSAADQSARLVGFRAAWTLNQLRRTKRPDEVWLSLEEGMPLTARANRCRHRAEATAVAWVLKGYPRVVVLATSDMEVRSSSLAPLWRQVDGVVTPSEGEGRRLSARLGVPPRLIQVDPSWVPEDRTVPPWPRGVITPSGPREWEWSERLRHLAGPMARRLLGHHYDAVRARTSSLLRRAKAMVSREVHREAHSD